MAAVDESVDDALKMASVKYRLMDDVILTHQGASRAEAAMGKGHAGGKVISVRTRWLNCLQ
jgi:hypothetical protein